MWFLFAVLSSITAALVAIFGKIGLSNVDSTLATSLRAIIMAVAVFGLALFTGKFSGLSQITGNNMLWIFLSGLAGAASWVFYFAALKMGDATKVAAIDRTSIIFVVILAILFLGEKLTWLKLFGAILIGIGAFLITR
ncbi:MAG: EamA family transporter [Patescibacteria group bacterium]